MTISLTLFLPLSLIFVFLIVIMYVCRATFLSQVLACTSLYVLRIIIIIIIIIIIESTDSMMNALKCRTLGVRACANY